MRPPIPIILYQVFFIYIYNAIQHLLQWLQVVRMQIEPVMCSWDPRVDVVGIGGGSLLGLMIEAPHSLHTHIRSSLYIYNAIQHLLQWLQVIRMQLQPVICSWDPRVDVLLVAGVLGDGSLLW
jgi:hypothetical protein